MKKKLLICSIAFLILANTLLAQEEKTEAAGKQHKERTAPKESWGIKGNFNSWGIIAGGSTPYFKSQENQYIIFPIIDHPFFKYQGFQKDFYINPMIAITPSLTYSQNYLLDNNTLSKKYQNIDNRYGSIEAGIATSVRLGTLSATIGLKGDTSNSYNGNRYYATLNGRKIIKPTQMMIYSLTYNNYSENFMDYYFGISKSESANTGLNERHPDSGGSLSANISYLYIINPKFSFIVSGGIEYLSSEAKSDILKSESSSQLALILSWKPN